MKNDSTPSEYRGMTHPNHNLKRWKKVNCSRNMHLFDEVKSLDEHYLYCDACDLMVFIERIEDGEE